MVMKRSSLPKRVELKDVSADWHIAEQPGQLKTLKKHPRINKVRIPAPSI